MTAFIRTKKIAAMLAAVMTVQTAVCSSHILQPISVGASEKTLSVTEFARDLQVFSLFDDPEEAYDTLVYHKEAGVLYADGQPVGTRRGDLTVGEEGLLICANAKGDTKGMLTESPLLLPFEENADRWGYTVTEENGLYTIRNEFQTARLIVKATGEIDDLGAKAVVSGYRDLTILQYADSAEAYAAYQIYAADSNVEYVQPSRYVSVAGQPADLQADAAVSGLESGSYYTWGANYLRTDLFYDTYLADRELTEDVIVAVLDTGINPRHSMVAGRVVEGGVNFSGSGDDSAEDDYGHGTHCAGTICELTPEQVKILPIKIFDAKGKATEEQIYAGLMYAIEQDADLLNMSFGGLGVSPLEAEAMALADAKGIICCAAAGNNSDEARYYYPGGIESCITVAAIDRDMMLADFSNYGDLVDVCAPGVGITSGVLGDNNKTEAWNGTSMATPHATACCAMLLLAWPELTPEACCAMLTANAVDLGETGFDEDYAWGLVSLADFAYTDGRCALPEFSEKAGNYGKGFSFEIECATEGAELYYTLDSSVPSPQNGIRYTGPISVSATTRVRVVAVKDGCMDSLVAECVYSVGGLDVPDPYEVENGVLKAYRGVVRRLAVPDVIDGQVITAIGDDAFAENPYLQEILLPDTVSALGASAFADCMALTSVEGSSVTVLGDAAFAGCRALEEVSFAAQLSNVGESAFADCSSLHMLRLDRLTAVPSGCFAGCSALESVYLPTAKSFGASAFENCASLAAVQCGWEAVTVLEDRVFAGCTAFAGSLGFVALEQLGESVFDGAESLLRVSLPEQITALPRRTFAGCRSLRQLVLPGITEIGDAALAVQQYTFGVSVELPFDRVTHIGTDAFYGCSLGSRGETTTFSAMTELPYRSFAAVVADVLAFPQVTAVYGQAFADAAVGIIELPAAQQLGDASVSNTDWVILSDACTVLHTSAIDAETQIYCTSPSQALLEYSEASGHIITDVPAYVYAFGTNSTVAQYTPLTLTLLTVGEGLRFQWYTVDENGSEIMIPEAESCRYLPVVSQTGHTVYLCKAQSDEGLVAEARYNVSVTAVEQEILELQKPVYYTDAASHTLLFVPQADGVYYFTSFGDVMSQGTVTDVQGELLGMMTQQPDGSELCTVTLQKGQQYLIHTAPMWQGVYALCASAELKQAQSVADLTVAYDSLFYPTHGDEIPAVTVMAPDGTLPEAERDYHMIFTSSNSRGRIYLFGLGNYSGCLVLPCSVYAPVYADTVNPVALSSKDDMVTTSLCPAPAESIISILLTCPATPRNTPIISVWVLCLPTGGIIPLTRKHALPMRTATSWLITITAAATVCSAVK
ncbi:MAG: leucine-rich repeat protein [Oscillospiraceae bacterium]|nr:leucine-rich repeat protein [Oscillospiraceae bacterium]